MSNKEPGYVYILTNPCFREDWVKICKSSCSLYMNRQLNVDPTMVQVV